MKKGAINVGFNPRKMGFSGETALVAKVDRYSTISYADIISYASKAAAVPESSMTMAMEAIFDAMSYFVLNGHSVQIPNLGTFSITVRCKASDSLEDFTADFASNLRNVVIRFLPSPELKADLSKTAIKTNVGDLTGYTSAATINVRVLRATFGANNGQLASGDIVLLKSLGDIYIQGTRLSKGFLGPAPVTIQYVEPDSNSVKQLVLPPEVMSQRYDCISIWVAKLRQLIPAAKYLSSLTVATAGGGTVKAYSFTVPATDGFAIASVFLGGVRVAEGSTVAFTPGKTLKFSLLAVSTSQVATVRVGETEAEITSIGTNTVAFETTVAAADNAPITVLDEEETVLGTFNLSFADTASAAPVISSITANGIALLNGAATEIVVGDSYTLRMAGQNLDLLNIGMFTVPSGATPTIISQSATQITMTLANAQVGTLAVAYNGATLFTGTLVDAASSVTLSGYKESANGATRSFSTAIEVDANANESLFLVGEGIDTLTVDNFVPSSAAVTNGAYNAETGQYTFRATAAGSVYIRVNNATIATILVEISNTGDTLPD